MVFFEVAYTDVYDGQCEPLFKELRSRDTTVAWVLASNAFRFHWHIWEAFVCSLFYSKRLFSGYSRYSPLDKNHNFSLFLFLNNMGDKYLHNFAAKILQL